MRVIEFVVL